MTDAIIKQLKAENKAFKKRLARLAGKVPNRPKRLSRRDQFAAAAMGALISAGASYGGNQSYVKSLSQNAINHADALIAELDKGSGLDCDVEQDNSVRQKNQGCLVSRNFDFDKMDVVPMEKYGSKPIKETK